MRIAMALIGGLTAVAMAAASALAASGEGGLPPVVVYTKANAPPTPKLQTMPLASSVSQYGITWTFAQPVRTGKFINGDWYVVGPVTVAKIDPAPRYGKEVADDELDKY